VSGTELRVARARLCAQGPAPGSVAWLPARGEHDDRSVRDRRVLPDGFSQRKAIHLWHLDIGQYEGELAS
jgi:hypothetical protein